MKVNRLFSAGATLALLGAFGASGLQAQGSNSPYSYAVKIRGGLVGGDMQTNHSDNKIMGLGAEVKRQMFANGTSLSAELTFEIVPGRHFDITKWERVPTPNGGLNLVMKSPLVMEGYWSYDDRKERGEGWSLRLAYNSPMPVIGVPILDDITRKMEWFGGLGIDRYKVTSEFQWTLRDQSAANLSPFNPDGTPNNGYRGNVNNLPLYIGGGGSFNEQAAELNVGIFAGVKYRINSDLAFEVALRNFGMKHWDFTPGAYFGTAEGKLESGSNRGTSIEFALSLKL